MEWIETIGKTVDEAKEAALDQLGVGADEAEFEVLESPRPGLFGRLRGEARVRTRVRPTEVRPKVERRRRTDRKPRSDRPRGDERVIDTGADPVAEQPPVDVDAPAVASSAPAARSDTAVPVDDGPSASPDEVGKAAVEFVDGLIGAFGMAASTELIADGIELEVAVSGSDLGLLIGPGGRTLLSIQNLARVAAQRRLGDHDTRLRIDIAGYREKRRLALEAFALRVATEVRETGTARALEPMPSADRKIIHDVLNGEAGVSSRSEGEDPDRRVVVAPAS